MTSERPEYAEKVRSMHAMAPAVMFPKPQAFMKLIVSFADSIEVVENISLTVHIL